jgi:cytochrome c553
MNRQYRFSVSPRASLWRAALWAWPLAASCGSAFAQDSTTLQTRALAATCANCHGTAGHAIDDSAVPGLGGMPAGYFVEQMNAFKSGARAATVMHQLAKGYNAAQIDRLAAYFAAQKK